MDEQVRAAFEAALYHVLERTGSFHAYVPELDKDLFGNYLDGGFWVHIPGEGDGRRVRLRVNVTLDSQGNAYDGMTDDELMA